MTIHFTWERPFLPPLLSSTLEKEIFIPGQDFPKSSLCMSLMIPANLSSWQWVTTDWHWGSTPEYLGPPEGSTPPLQSSKAHCSVRREDGIHTPEPGRLGRWKSADAPCSWIGSLQFAKTPTFPKWMLQLKADSIKSSLGFSWFGCFASRPNYFDVPLEEYIFNNNQKKKKQVDAFQILKCIMSLL